jgi:type 1 glutamine amidotransferase
MCGAVFVGHPEAETLSFQVDVNYPISKGIDNFKLFEEPYRYEFCNDAEKQVFLTYQYDGRDWESGWTSRYGKGKIVCLHPGHNIKPFENDCYRQIICRSALWCVANKL